MTEESSVSWALAVSSSSMTETEKTHLDTQWGPLYSSATNQSLHASFSFSKISPKLHLNGTPLPGTLTTVKELCSLSLHVSLLLKLE